MVPFRRRALLAWRRYSSRQGSCWRSPILFATDIPLALRAAERAAVQAKSPHVAILSSGLRRGIVKALLFGVGNATACAGMGATMWRVRRQAPQAD